MEKIVSNKIRCLHCGDIIESKHTHDFKTCKCGKVYVDGGLSYMRRGFPSGNWKDHYEELSVYEQFPDEDIDQHIPKLN